MKFATQAGLISTIKLVIQSNDIDPAECVDEDVSQRYYCLQLYFCVPHKDGRTLLHHAAEYGHTDIVELLLNGKRRVDVNCKDFVHEIII